VNLFFDVQGTLISAGQGRPGIRDAFEELVGAGHELYIWSSAGPGYARRAAEALGIEDLILDCYGKDPDIPVDVDFTIDDQASMTGRRGGYTIPPFTGDPDDREMERVVEHLRR
jgi:hypothetical protein